METETQLEVAEMRIVRFFVVVKRKDKSRNEHIRRTLKVNGRSNSQGLKVMMVWSRETSGLMTVWAER